MPETWNFGWWVVLDRSEPDYGAHCVLATDAREAAEKGVARWYDDVGEYLETLVAVRLPLDVTWEQMSREGSVVKGFSREEIEEIATSYGKKVLELRLETGEERWLLVATLPCTLAVALERLGRHPSGEAYRRGELVVSINGNPATLETLLEQGDYVELRRR